MYIKLGIRICSSRGSDFRYKRIFKVNQQGSLEAELKTLRNELAELKKKVFDLEKDLKRQ